MGEGEARRAPLIKAGEAWFSRCVVGERRFSGKLGGWVNNDLASDVTLVGVGNSEDMES